SANQIDRGAGDARQRVTGGGDREEPAGLESENTGEFPIPRESLRHRAMAGTRQVPNIRADKPVSAVARGGTVAQEEVERVRGRCVLGSLVTRLKIERLGPRVRSQQGETVAIPLVERN